MGTNVYGGDEVGALVFDPGFSSFRCGYAGEDAPKSEIPSHVCSQPELSDLMDVDYSLPSRKKKYYIGSNFINVPRKDAEIENFLKDGMIEDWDIFENILNLVYKQNIMSRPEDHPVLMSEASWNDKAHREKLTEIMFEKYGIPAFFLVKSAVLSAFANGRPTALVYDSGASQTSVVPVFEGYVLQSSIVRIPHGSQYVTKLCKKYFEENNIVVEPTYKVASKQHVKDKEKPIWTAKQNLPPVKSSWHNFMVDQIVDDFQISVLQILDEPFNKEAVDGVPPTLYEFPNGYNQQFYNERYTIPEVLFNPKFNTKVSGDLNLNFADVLLKSVALCDIDIMPALYNSVVVSGGNTLLTGFNDRLLAEVTKKIPPNIRVKLMYPNGLIERRHSPWIGGSILASLGTFQRLWFSKQEYEDGGKALINKKCP